VTAESARMQRTTPPSRRRCRDRVAGVSADLQRFVSAQDQGGTYERALAELRAGRKSSHWMWFVFPQVAGLGRSAMAQEYALASLDEARAYLAHPVLGPRLHDCCAALLDVPTDDPVSVLGSIDATKLRSSMTLFERAGADEPVFAQVLEKYFGGARDDATLDRL
jgi:uncharacterized protein (DUF1810 family)